MSQNTSSAVMQQRVEPHDSLDHFPTPLWAARALCEHVAPLSGYAVWESACGDGGMARALGEYASAVVASDVHDYGWGHLVRDFLWPDSADGLPWIDWVVTNPPFRLAEQFAYQGNRIARHGVCLLVRTSFIEGIGRYERLFSVNPPAIVAQFTERVPMVKGRLDPEASTATSYCWLVWHRDPPAQTRLAWIPPCRRQLERDGDYPSLYPQDREP